MKRRHPALFALVAVLALYFCSSAPAATVSHPFLSAITGVGTPSGGFEDACGVAADSAGDLYVSDYYHDAIDITRASPQLSLQVSGIDPTSGPCRLALDSSGNLYVYSWHHEVLKYVPSEFPPEPSTEYGSPTVVDAAEPTGLAVDPVTDDVYVAHRTYVSVYDSAGALVGEIGATGSLEGAYGVAVSAFPSTAGFVYVPDAADHILKVFDPAASATTPIAEIDGAATPQGGFVRLVDSEVVVDNSASSPSYGHVYLLDTVGLGGSEQPEAVVDEFNAAGAYRGQITGFTSAEPSGIALDPSSHNVYVTSGNSEGSAVFVYGPTAPAQTLTLTKSGTGSGTITSSPAGISCGAACVAEFDHEKHVTLFAAPDAHSVLTGWTVTGAEPCPGAGSCTVVLGADVEVKANFSEPVQQTLTVSTSGEGTVTSSPGAISCPGTCVEHFNQGRQVALLAHPAPHYRLSGWSGCVQQANPLECKVTMGSDQTVSAEFTPIPQVLLTVSKTGAGQGTVTSSPAGISCPGVCSASFDQGSIVTLIAAPAPVSSFTGFSGGGCSGTAVICELTMAGPVSVAAQFGAGGAVAAAPAAARLKLAAPHSLSGQVVVPLWTSGPGKVVAAGPSLRTTDRAVEGGHTTIRVSVSRRARRRLADHRAVNTKVTVAFVPAAGGPAVAETRVLHIHPNRWTSSKR